MSQKFDIVTDFIFLMFFRFKPTGSCSIQTSRRAAGAGAPGSRACQTTPGGTEHGTRA